MKMLTTSYDHLEWGLLLIRVGIGLIFVIHGWGKIFNPETWHWMGSQMSNVGIVFFPKFWGFLAASAEFFGGLCLVFGFATRIVSVALAFVMAIALTYHFGEGHDFKRYSHALSLLVIFIGLALAGPGRFSTDFYISQKLKR